MNKIHNNNIIGETLSELRKDKGLTQKEIASVFHVSEGTIAHYEQGKTIPNTEILMKFAEYYQVPVDYLLGRCECKIEYKKLNDNFSGDFTIGDIVNIIDSLSEDKKKYLTYTINLLK